MLPPFARAEKVPTKSPDQIGSSAMVMVSDCSSTATSRRSKRKVPTTAMASGDDLADDRYQHDPAGVCAASVWTEAMHSSFLHDMEAAFVHDILFGWPVGRAASNHHHQQQQPPISMGSAATTDATPRLDRYMPESAESTRDGHGDAPSAPASPWEVKRRRIRSIRRSGFIDGGESTTVLSKVSYKPRMN